MIVGHKAQQFFPLPSSGSRGELAKEAKYADRHCYLLLPSSALALVLQLLLFDVRIHLYFILGNSLSI